MPVTPATWPYPRLIAHRGAGRLAPENTLASIRLGTRHGYRMVEFDVKLSQDGVPVLLHDDTLDRTSNAQGLASDRSYAQLAEIDFGGWHGATYAGEPIPTLYAVAASTLTNGVHSNIEIKPTTGDEEATGRTVAELARKLWRHAPLPPLLSSFSEASLEAAMQVAPELPRALLIEGPVPDDWQARLERLQCTGVNPDNRHVDANLVRAMRSAGYTVSVWTVNDTERMRALFDWGCNAVFTDEVASIAPTSFDLLP
ncbi:glycerophosphodiester phosphodiesterase [Allopusillimonas soli]|uniref:Glycerophosphodiester phosphodiesterase n=1 Tax=Allopusillimonas soli TaxID=659016 RepID=A0A853F9L0_9BURK|nr:glycerophosphodiester phosphodiesterase [Allopusillimonas soli]NYT36619.1 glycerophosphodiester phosphodiesterase [Allopusillimonas soli]TEA75107.1 glycerophosphodiester phosphodiesterase [Allopusillimonas soli]